MSFPKPPRLLWVLLLLLLQFLPTQHPHAQTTPSTRKLIEKRTPHFHFHYPARWTKIARYLWSRAEQDLRELEATLGTSFQAQLQVRLAPASNFASIQPGRWQPHPNIAGLAYPHKKLMTLRIKAVDGPQKIHQTFRHELSHLLLYYAANYKHLPLWFVEGTAMVQSQDYGLFDRFVMMSQAQLSNSIPDLDRIKARFPQGNASQIAYATSCEMLLFLQNRHPNFLASLLKQIRKGVPFSRALSAQTGVSWKELKRQWNAHLSTRYSWIPLLSSSSLLWILSAFFFLFAYRKVKRQRKAQLAMLPDDPHPPQEEFVPFLPSSPQLPNGQKIFSQNQNKTKHIYIN